MERKEWKIQPFHKHAISHEAKREKKEKNKRWLKCIQEQAFIFFLLMKRNKRLKK